MKTLLLNTPWYKDDLYFVRAGSRWPHFEKYNGDGSYPYMPFPFYLSYAAALLLKNKYDVEIIDGVALHLSQDDLITKVKESNADIIVQEVSTSTINYDLDYSRMFKEINQDSFIIYCGPNALMNDEIFLQENQEVDLVIYGEYEHTLLNVVKKYNKDIIDFEGLEGVIFRRDDKVIKNKAASLIENLDSLPWPAREMLPMNRYLDTVGGLPEPSLQVWASRGCPYSCNFCLWPQIMYMGRNYRVRHPLDVASEIEYCVKKWGFKSFYFDDDTFNIGKSRILALAKAIKQKNLKLPFAVMARADTMDEEQLVALQDAGLVSLKYEVESGSQELVDNCGKGLNLEKVREIVTLTKELAIKVHLTFSFGLPGETLETVEKTINFAKELDPDTLQFSIITPFPGSSYYQELDDKGYILTKNWEEYSGYTSAVIRTDHMSKDDLENSLKKANREWHIHQHLKTKEFYGANLRGNLEAFKNKKRVVVLFSSFSEHIQEVLTEVRSMISSEKIILLFTKNKKAEVALYFSDIKNIKIKGDNFTRDSLETVKDYFKDSISIIPTHNSNYAGYEEIISFFRANSGYPALLVDASGNACEA